MKVRCLAVVVLAGLALGAGAGCTKIYNDRNPAAPSVTPLPAPAPAAADTIEFRVFGSVGTAPVAVRYTNSRDGLTALAAVSLPYVATVKNLDDSIFLDLEASASPALSWVSSSYLQIQIYANGRLFREAFISGVSPLNVAASGTFRR